MNKPIVKIFKGKTIGKIRRALFTKKPSKWNAIVRDITAYFG